MSKETSGPNLLHAINAGYILEDGSFGVLDLQLEQAGDKIQNLSFAADLESLSALALAITNILASMVSAQDKSGSLRAPSTIGFKEIAVLPGNRLDESDAITLVLTTTSGLKLTFGLERLVAEELQQGLGKTLLKN